MPHRVASTTAKVDAASVAIRPCFLCAANRPPEQRGLPFGDGFTLLCNPFPVVARHLTVVHDEHRPQRLDGSLGTLLDLAAALPGSFAVYNGPRCGASAPDHLHLQAGALGELPLVAEAAGAPGPALETRGARALLFRGDRARLLDEARRALEVLGDVARQEPEPWCNVVAWREDGGALVLVLFPRGRHRPEAFHTGARTVSPAALDMSGLLVTPFRSDFDALTGEEVAAVYREVSLAEEPFRGVVARLGARRAGETGARVTVGLMEKVASVDVELLGGFTDPAGVALGPGRRLLATETTLLPADPAGASFALDGVTIGIGFHWERQERQLFRGTLRLLRRPGGLTVVNDVPLEEYVTSVVSSEMSATCPAELLKAHAVISRSWLKGPSALGVASPGDAPAGEVLRWYGREAHADFEVCADDHCQRYQGITKEISPAAAEAVRATAGEFLLHDGAICDTRFSKCCGGLTERYSTAWDDAEVPYLVSLPDGLDAPPPDDLEAFIRSSPAAFCNAAEPALLARILPGFDQETRDFFRWRVVYAPEELGEIVASRLGVDLGPIASLEPLARGPSGRIFRLRISGARGSLVVGKELEIRRALSRSHLYSSAFVVDRDAAGRFVLTGAGWGHGVGLCQIGATVMAERGFSYREILAHYYPGTAVGRVGRE